MVRVQPHLPTCPCELTWDHFRSKIVLTSRRQLPLAWADPRIDFIAIDFSGSVEGNVKKLESLASDVTHVFYTAYAHSDSFKGLPELNVPLFKNFLDVVDAACPKLQRVCIYTGGKV